MLDFPGRADAPSPAQIARAADIAARLAISGIADAEIMPIFAALDAADVRDAASAIRDRAAARVASLRA